MPDALLFSNSLMIIQEIRTSPKMVHASCSLMKWSSLVLHDWSDTHSRQFMFDGYWQYLHLKCSLDLFGILTWQQTSHSDILLFLEFCKYRMMQVLLQSGEFPLPCVFMKGSHHFLAKHNDLMSGFSSRWASIVSGCATLAVVESSFWIFWAQWCGTSVVAQQTHI